MDGKCKIPIRMDGDIRGNRRRDLFAFLFLLEIKIKVSLRLDPQRATVHRTVAFDCSNPSFEIKENPIRLDGVLSGGAGGI